MRQLFILLFSITCLFSCDKIDELTQFNLDFESKVTVPASTGLNTPIVLFSPEVTTNSETVFESNNTNKDLVEEIRLTALQLQISSPSGGDFGFLKSISISISADGLSDKQVAWDNDVSSSAGATLDLEVSSDDLKEYIKKDRFSIKATTTTDEFITQDHEIKVISKLKILKTNIKKVRATSTKS